MFPPTPGNDEAVTEDNKLLQIRQTSFGCGRLGATVWPSSIALASLLARDTYRSSIQVKRILELGSGCGLPTLTAKEVCSADQVLATGYWEKEGLIVGNRLLPKICSESTEHTMLDVNHVISIGAMNYLCLMFLQTSNLILLLAQI